MKKLSFILVIIMATAFSACNKDDFSEDYANPSKIADTNVEKQFAGFLVSNKDYVLPAYWNYFVAMRTTVTRHTQAVGWVNEDHQYVPGEAGAAARWGAFYGSLNQYREMEKIYNALTVEEQERQRIFMLLGTMYLYDHLQRTVDLFGDMPFSQAGRLSQNGGEYIVSLPTYDTAESIYTTMLDGLKGFAEELNTLTIDPAILAILKKQDFVNNGDIEKWKMYCNSLRLRMLTRVSGSSEFQARASSEIAAILSNSGSFPVVDSNTGNIQINVYDVSSAIHAKGFESGLESWDGNIAGKAMIDNMLANTDPRLRVMFELGADAVGETYLGLDPLMNSNDQTTLVNDGTLSLWNTTTFSRNDYFPGVLITASEVQLIKAEAYLSTNDALAKENYEEAIANSINFFYDVRTLSNDASGQSTELIDFVPLDPAEVTAYVASEAAKWDNATTDAEKMALIATQKWIHFSVVQLPDSWAEIRRTGLPSFSFLVDNSDVQTLPPDRWYYPNSEVANNADIYATIRDQDKLTNKLFWAK